MTVISSVREKALAGLLVPAESNYTISFVGIEDFTLTVRLSTISISSLGKTPQRILSPTSTLTSRGTWFVNAIYGTVCPVIAWIKCPANGTPIPLTKS
jgi:hypothetical protein